MTENNPSQSRPYLRIPRSLLGRLYLLAAILAADCALEAAVPHAVPLLGPVAPVGIVFLAVFLGLGLRRLEEQRQEIPFRPALFWAHLGCVCSVFLGSLLAERPAGTWLNMPPALRLSGALLATGILLLTLSLCPLGVWLAVARRTSPAWQYAGLAGVAAWILRAPSQQLWIQSTATNVYLLQILTFRSVQWVLGLLLPDLVVDAGPFVIGTPRFAVSVGAPCSGIEGLGLVLVFTLVWLWFFRKENRVPRALLLIPCALSCAFVLNVLRIAALILIGNAGAPEAAFVGFHSQAGWIAFTLVALGFSIATQRLAWFRKSGGGVALAGPNGSGTMLLDVPQEPRAESPATAAYLVPFLAILAASFISRSASGYFEWLYPLRFAAAGGALWLFRREYRGLKWRFGWAAPLTGMGIFLLWIAPEWVHTASTASAALASPIATSLAGLGPVTRWLWIGVRATAAVVTVPLAEELAFRGYLARRLTARQFDQLPFARLTLAALALSSLAFGLMHGQHWLLGTAAGLAYAALLRQKGRIGDAVAAHAVSNLLLAAWVVARGDWGLW